MTRIDSVEVECSGCGHGFTAFVLRSTNNFVPDPPKLRPAACPRCGLEADGLVEFEEEPEQLSLDLGT